MDCSLLELAFEYGLQLDTQDFLSRGEWFANGKQHYMHRDRLPTNKCVTADLSDVHRPASLSPAFSGRSFIVNGRKKPPQHHRAC